MRKRIAIYGSSEEMLQLIPLLAANPDVEIAGIWDPDPEGFAARLAAVAPRAASGIESWLVRDPAALARDPGLYAVIDASGGSEFAERFPETAERGVQIVSPLTARLLWGYGAPAADRKLEVLGALQEVVESYNLTVNTDELFERMLEIALGVTGAEGGSLMLLDPEARELRVRVAVGVEPELWPKIRVALGEGIAGRVAAEARALRLRGKADRQAFRILRERLDVESALCVPLVHAGRVLGVLNLHHATRPDAFGEADLDFVQQLAALDAQIIARAQEHEALRSQAARYEAVKEVQRLLGGPAGQLLAGRQPLPARLASLCRFVAGRAGGGIATLYLHDPDEGDLRLAASSLAGGGFGEEYRIPLGQGLDGGAAASRQPAFLRRPDGALAYAALPLVAGDALAGVLSVQAGPQPPRGRAAEETLLELAAAAAQEIATERSRARIDARATQVGAINEAGIRMIAARDPAEVLRLATSSAAMVLEAEHAVLRLEDEETRRYVIRSYFGSADGKLQEKLFRLDKRVSVDVLKKRAPLHVRSVADDPQLREYGTDVRSLVAAPLKREGRVIGTLALYDKVSSDRFAPGSFGAEDLQLLAKLASYVEQAVANALEHAHARRFQNFDEETGLPNAAYVSKRIDEELARAAGHDGALAIAVCLVENLREIEHRSDASHARRVVQRTADGLRAHVRDFDVAARTAEDEFTVLLPDPGSAPGDRVFDLARGVAEHVARDEALNRPVRVALAFGYAVHPEEARDRDTLLSRAREPRIRMV
jgi:diguanylate cyclase (GGDEF)-like protein